MCNTANFKGRMELEGDPRRHPGLKRETIKVVPNEVCHFATVPQLYMMVQRLPKGTICACVGYFGFVFVLYWCVSGFIILPNFHLP